MKLVLFCMNTEGSPHFASFKLARQLMEEGCRVIYVGFRFFRPLVLMQDLEYLAIDEDPDGNDTRTGIPSSAAFASTDRQIGNAFCIFMDRWLDNNLPDLTIIDNIRMLDYSLPFHKRKIPILAFGSNLSSSFSTRYPPVTSHRIPAEQPHCFDRLINIFEWSKLYAGNLFKNLIEWRRAINITVKYGGSYEFGEYGYKLKAPNVIAMIDEFNFPAASRKHPDKTIGMALDTERVEGKPLSFRIAKDKKLIYCSLGTHRYAARKYVLNFFNAVIDSVGKKKDMQLLVHLREEEKDLVRIDPAYDNVFIASWVPQVEVLSQTHIFITHGGLGSVRESVFLGVPMIVFPLAVDQPGNAARIVYHKLGLKADLKKANTALIDQLLSKMTCGRTYFDSADRMRTICLDKYPDSEWMARSIFS